MCASSALLLVITAHGGEHPLKPQLFLTEQPPRLLSAYGLFSDAVGQQPNAGLMPYDLLSPLHSDYSDKYRFLYIPEGQSVPYSKEGVLDFPVGSALIKTFAYPASNASNAPLRLLETRLLVHLAKGWQPRVYIWNQAQTEAVYKVAGKTITVDWFAVGGDPRPLRYRVPNLNQCTTCHSIDKTMMPLGLHARNLDHDFAYARFGLNLGTRNQLKLWQQRGILSGLPTRPEHPVMVAWHDADADLNARARAYLDINCGHCHQPGGGAHSTGLYLHYDETRPLQLGIRKKPTASGRGSGGRLYDLVPGHPEQSILLYRMASADPGERMPEISLVRPHPEGIELIRDWILSLK